MLFQNESREAESSNLKKKHKILQIVAFPFAMKKILRVSIIHLVHLKCPYLGQINTIFRALKQFTNLVLASIEVDSIARAALYKYIFQIG